MKKLQPIKSSCGGQGCEIKKYVLPYMIKKDVDACRSKDASDWKVKKAA